MMNNERVELDIAKIINNNVKLIILDGVEQHILISKDYLRRDLLDYLFKTKHG